LGYGTTEVVPFQKRAIEQEKARHCAGLLISGFLTVA
jgi:hypothetical protein